MALTGAAAVIGAIKGATDYIKKKSGQSQSSANKSSSGSSGRTSTLVYAPDGSVKQGYIQAGKTYLNDGSRIGEGYSTIDASGRVWKMSNGKGALQGNINQGYNPAGSAQQQYYENQLSKMRAQAEAAARAQAEAQKAQIAASKNEINANYDNSARQAYIASMQNQRALPEMMSTQGMAGGATESAMLGLRTNYENNLADLEAARNKALADADLGLNDVNANLAGTLADINSQYGMKQLELAKDAQDTAKSDYITTINQYYDDYQAEINRLLASGVPETDYRIQYLRAARQQKIADQKEKEEQAALEAAKLAAKYRYSSGSSSNSDDGDDDVFGFGTKGTGTTSGEKGKNEKYSYTTEGNEYEGAGAIVLQKRLDALAKAGAYTLPMIQEQIAQALKSGTITANRARALIERYGI